MDFKSFALSGAAAVLSILGLLLMFIALQMDALFVTNVNGEKIECGWKEIRGTNSESKKHQDYSAMDMAGQFWLCWALISIMWGLAGSFCCCIFTKVPHLRKCAIMCLSLAANIAIVAAAGAFGFWSRGEDPPVCDEYMDVGASIILAFVTGFLFLFATIFMFLIPQTEVVRKTTWKERSTQRYAQFDDYQEKYSEPVTMKGETTVAVHTTTVPVRHRRDPRT